MREGDAALQEAGRELKDARAQVGARRRAFPRHAPSSHAAALEALEKLRQDQAAAGPSLPQVGLASLVRMHSDVLSFPSSSCWCRGPPCPRSVLLVGVHALKTLACRLSCSLLVGAGSY